MEHGERAAVSFGVRDRVVRLPFDTRRLAALQRTDRK
jgi:hypothetical protein